MAEPNLRGKDFKRLQYSKRGLTIQNRNGGFVRLQK
jgi:hypothetical protein